MSTKLSIALGLALAFVYLTFWVARTYLGASVGEGLGAAVGAAMLAVVVVGIPWSEGEFMESES